MKRWGDVLPYHSQVGRHTAKESGFDDCIQNSGGLCLAGFGAIVFEKILKSKSGKGLEEFSVWDRNIQLAIYSIIIYLPAACYETGWQVCRMMLVLKQSVQLEAVSWFYAVLYSVRIFAIRFLIIEEGILARKYLESTHCMIRTCLSCARLKLFLSRVVLHFSSGLAGLHPAPSYWEQDLSQHTKVCPRNQSTNMAR